MGLTSKADISCDKHEWSPSPLLGQVVLVTTIHPDGTPNVAPKSWVSMVAFGPPPVVMFGCNHQHRTARNALGTGEFVINVPGVDLMEASWAVGADVSAEGLDRFHRNGLTALPAIRVRPPRIEECLAHLECEVEGSRDWKEEVAIFGRVVAVSMNTDLLAGDVLRGVKLGGIAWAGPIGRFVDCVA